MAKLMYFHPARRGVTSSVVPVRPAGSEDEWRSVRAANVGEEYHSQYGPLDGGAVESRTINAHECAGANVAKAARRCVTSAP